MALAAFLAAIAFRPIYSICLAGYQSYVVAYLFLLYLLLIPGLVSGAGGRYVVFYYALSFLLLSPLLITGRRVRWAKLAAIIATVIPLAIGFMFSIYAATTGEILNKTSLFVIYQTNLREAFGYIETSLDQRIIVAFVLLFLVPIVLLLHLPRLRHRTGRVSMHGILVAMALLLVCGTREKSNERKVWSSAWEYRSLMQDNRK